MSDLTTVDAVKIYLGINSSADDVLIGSLVTAASAYIETWISRRFDIQNYTDLFNGYGGNSWVLRNYPVVSITSVTVNGSSISRSVSISSPGFDSDDISVVLRGYTFCRGQLNCAIEYMGGYTVPPDEISQACIELVAARYKEKDRIGLVSKALAGETTSYSQRDMPASVKAILNNYKKVTTN